MNLFKNIILRIKGLFHYLSGNEEDFHLQHRLYNTYCVILLLILIQSVPINIITGYYTIGIILLALLIIQSVLYYLSRFKGWLKLCILITGLSCYFLSGTYYFLHAGLKGATLINNIALFFFLITVSSPKQRFWWLIASLAFYIALPIVEFYYPKSIQNTINTRAEYFEENVSTYIWVLLMIYWFTSALVRSYQREKNKSELKTIELEKSNAEKNRLFSIISHDLRSPLTSIQSYLELLTDVDLALKDRIYLEKELLKNTAGTKEMLDNLLLWSKSQMEGVKVNVTSVDVLDALRSTIELSAQISANKNITLTIDLPEKLFIRADKDMLQLIVRNLLSNAAKFTSKNGKIHIAAAVNDGFGVIEIRDNGLGINVEKQKDIFSSNVKPTQGTNNEKGVGLGLVLCKEYTELQDGSISFRSKPGDGTSFFITFPIPDKSNSAHISVA